jgi:hypothetical protein
VAVAADQLGVSQSPARLASRRLAPPSVSSARAGERVVV